MSKAYFLWWLYELLNIIVDFSELEMEYYCYSYC